MANSTKLSPLPGTAKTGDWTGTNEFGAVNLSEAVFPLFRRVVANETEIVGTAFYVLRNGCFITAQHVLEDHKSLFAIHFGPGLTRAVRPVIAAYHHPISDISVGVLAPLSHVSTGEALRNVTLTITPKPPACGSLIATYAYPLHKVFTEPTGVSINVQPDFYDGKLGDYYAERGPSGKLACPYHMADLHLYGASSGGPVFSTTGRAFALASSSFDGANDLAFLTPLALAGDIIIPDADLKDGLGVRALPFRHILEAHFGGVRRHLRSSL